MKVDPITLIGKHIRLEPMTEAHIPDLAAVGNDPSLWRYNPHGQPTTESAMRDWALRALRYRDQGIEQPFVVIHLASGKTAGATRYMDIRPAHRGLEIGSTWYGIAFQRTAVNTEAKYLLLRHAFEQLDCIRVQLKADSRNERSLKAIERIGAVREGLLRNHIIMPDGVYRHSVYFSILNTEWPAVKIHLEELLAK